MSENTIQSNLSNAFDSKETIFKDRYVFNENYAPDLILHRDQEIQEISNFFKSFWRGSRGFLNIHGSVGTGKTLITKKIAKGFLDRTKTTNHSRSTIIFINCSNFDTRSQILRKIAKELDENENVGWGIGMYIEKIETQLKKFDNVLLILDEVDKVVSKQKEKEIFYNLSNQPKFSLICISNVTEWMSKYIDDARVKSRQSETLTTIFLPYSKHQIFDILKDRAEKGLRKGSYEDAALELVADKAAQRRGDMREALAIMNSAVKLAQELRKTKVKRANVISGDERLQKDETIEHIRGQTPPKRALMALIMEFWDRKRDYPTAGELKNRYNSLVKLHPTLEQLKLDSIRTYLIELCTYEYVEKIPGSGQGRGKGRAPNRYKLAIDEDRFREEFYNKIIKPK